MKQMHTKSTNNTGAMTQNSKRIIRTVFTDNNKEIPKYQANNDATIHYRFLSPQTNIRIKENNKKYKEDQSQTILMYF